MFSSQAGACAVCKSTEWGKAGPHIDHDHKTGIVRGILCQKCNMAAGLLGDNPATAERMLAYLSGRAA